MQLTPPPVRSHLTSSSLAGFGADARRFASSIDAAPVVSQLESTPTPLYNIDDSIHYRPYIKCFADDEEPVKAKIKSKRLGMLNFWKKVKK